MKHKRNSLTGFISIFLVLFLNGILSSCELKPTYSAKTLSQQLIKVAKEEENTDVTCNIYGKTLWVHVPLKNLIDEQKIGWDTNGLEQMGRILTIAHRAILSTDAKLDFINMVAVDTKRPGIELSAIEYIPDIKEAMYEKISRGEFFMRSIRNVTLDALATDELSEKIEKNHSIPFDQFLCLQIIHRVKNLFARDKKLANLFEIKSTSSSYKFGIFKLNFEFMQKQYTVNEKNLTDPFDHVKIIIAAVIKNYQYKDFQIIEITDTFSNKTLKLTLKDIQAIGPEKGFIGANGEKIKLPMFDD